MVKEKSKSVSKGVGIVALLLNILVLPGLGSLIGKKTSAGIIQIIIYSIGLGFLFTLIGIFIGGPLILAVWIWALITGINIVNESK